MERDPVCDKPQFQETPKIWAMFKSVVQLIAVQLNQNSFRLKQVSSLIIIKRPAARMVITVAVNNADTRPDVC